MRTEGGDHYVTASHLPCRARTHRVGLGSLPLLDGDCIQVSVQNINDNHPQLCFISFKAKTIDSSNTDAVDKGSSVDLSDPLLVNNFNSTVSPVKTKQAYLPANEGEHFSGCICENSRSVGSI